MTRQSSRQQAQRITSLIKVSKLKSIRTLSETLLARFANSLQCCSLWLERPEIRGKQVIWKLERESLVQYLLDYISHPAQLKLTQNVWLRLAMYEDDALGAPSLRETTILASISERRSGEHAFTELPQ